MGHALTPLPYRPGRRLPTACVRRGRSARSPSRCPARRPRRRNGGSAGHAGRFQPAAGSPAVGAGQGARRPPGPCRARAGLQGGRQGGDLLQQLPRPRRPQHLARDSAAGGAERRVRAGPAEQVPRRPPPRQFLHGGTGARHVQRGALRGRDLLRQPGACACASAGRGARGHGQALVREILQAVPRGSGRGHRAQLAHCRAGPRLSGKEPAALPPEQGALGRPHAEGHPHAHRRPDPLTRGLHQFDALWEP
jgi:hypothetical protein